MADYIIHKAVGPDKVKKSYRRALEDYGLTYEAQHKYDGCCAVMHLPVCGDPLVTSRTGETYVSLNGLAADVHWALYDDRFKHSGLVLIGEAWWPGKDQFNLISGEFRRGEVSDRLLFVLNDVLTMKEFAEGFSDVPYSARKQRLSGDLPDRVTWATAYPPGSYGCPQAFCNELVEMGGFDGLILRDPDGLWQCGNGTTGEIVKIKRVLSFDLRVVGIEEGKGKHAGRMGALVVDFMGRTLRVGTGFTDEQRAAWWITRPQTTIVAGADPILGKIVEVEAMDYSSDGLLREPRFKGVRLDKLEADAA